jgi:hypothetical protein
VDSSDSEYGPAPSACEHDKPSDSIEGGVCVDQVSECQLLKNDPRSMDNDFVLKTNIMFCACY